MTCISFTIPGRVKGKGRPKFAARGKFVKVYTPEDTVNAEGVVRHFGKEAMKGQRPLSGPLAVSVRIILNTPESWSNRRKAETLYVTGKPDLDNVVKLIGDALNGIIWTDDKQIACLSVVRVYDDTGPEQAFVEVQELGLRAIAQPERKPAEHALKATPLFGEIPA